MDGHSDAERIAHLEGRVAALEGALKERSRVLRLLQSQLCRRDLILFSRIEAGLPPLPFGDFEPAFWSETVALAPSDVEETLTDLWRSLKSVAAPPAGGGAGGR